MARVYDRNHASYCDIRFVASFSNSIIFTYSVLAISWAFLLISNKYVTNSCSHNLEAIYEGFRTKEFSK